MIKITITRDELLHHDACQAGLDFFAEIAPTGVLELVWDVPTQVRLVVEACRWIGWAQRANLVPYANLSCADLTGANLTGANLSCANLSCANLSCANLSCANLSCARVLTDTTPPDGWTNNNGVLQSAS